MLFRQRFDAETSTYTYLLADEASRAAALNDPVLEQVERDVKLVGELGLKLVLETPGHTESTIGEEKRHDPRLAGGTRESFISFMERRQLPPPEKLDVAVPANRACGGSEPRSQA